MFAAITVKYLGPTNYRGSRYKATCQAGNVTVDYDYELNASDNAKAAAAALIKKVGWDTNTWFMGQNDKGDYVVVIAEEFTQVNTNQECQ